MKISEDVRNLAESTYLKDVKAIISEEKEKIDLVSLTPIKMSVKIDSAYLNKLKRIVDKKLEVYINAYTQAEMTIDDADKNEILNIISQLIQKTFNEDINDYLKNSPSGDGESKRKSIQKRYNDVMEDVRLTLNQAISELKVKFKYKPARITLPAPPPLPNFSFIKNKDLRDIISRDYTELINLNAEKTRKSMVILSGAIIEGLLIDALVSNGMPYATATSKTFDSLIKTAHNNGIIKHDKISHFLRDYRNYVHPAKEIREKHVLTKADAEFSFAAAKIMVEELENWYKTRTPTVVAVPVAMPTPTSIP